MATTIATPATTTWKIDPAHSAAEFKVKHMMISNVKGSFPGLEGVLVENPVDPATSPFRQPSMSAPSPPAIPSATVISRAPTSLKSKSSRP